MFSVDIYIVITRKGGFRGKAAGMWRIRYTTMKGTEETREDIIFRECTTENALTLELLRDALSRLTKTCSVRVNTECAHILNTIKSRRLQTWRAGGWISAKGEPVKNMALWQEVAALMDRHLVEFVTGNHSYRRYMKYEIKRELERRRDNV
ncbi:MAG: hypothetical protein K2O16_03250 [Lachnospiraceae bacterium]|nr:hypothetical protein [Lachnospiraceae bacterium]